MKSRQRLLRRLLVYGLSPGILGMIAMVVVMRPLTAYQDGFNGPEAMWRDLVQWAKTGELRFPAWHQASRDHLRPHVHPENVLPPPTYR
jgi:hypothetical protein